MQFVCAARCSGGGVMCACASAIRVGGGEALAEVRQGDAVLRTSWASQRRNHLAKLDVHDCVIERFGARGAPEALRRAIPTQHPLAPGVAALTQRVRDGFDPAAILDPERFI